MLGVNQAGRQESRDRFILEKPRHQVELLVYKAEAVEDHRFDGMAGGDDAHLRVLLGRLVNDFSNAKFVKHARDKAKMIQDLTAVDLFHVLSSSEEILPTPKIAQIPSRVCGMSAMSISTQALIPRTIASACSMPA